MKMLVDVGHISYKWAAYPRRWELLDKLLAMDAVLCFDSLSSLRRDRYSWYKSNRGELLPLATQKLQKLAKRFQVDIQRSFPANCVSEHGLEADDILAIESETCDNCWMMTTDHDLLQLPNAFLVDQHMTPWGVDRIKQTRLPLKQGESYLVYQLLHGCRTDTVPRTIFSKDRYTAPWVFEQESPLQAALSVLPLDLVRDSLNCLMLPTPLRTREDPIEVALEKYGYKGALT